MPMADIAKSQRSPFENLCRLYLRNIRGDRSWSWYNVDIIQQNVVEVLIKSPNLKMLGLELDDDVYLFYLVFLKEVVDHFKRLREENGIAKFRLRIEELILEKESLQSGIVPILLLAF
jgi:hypothetical protein